MCYYIEVHYRTFASARKLYYHQTTTASHYDTIVILFSEIDQLCTVMNL